MDTPQIITEISITFDDGFEAVFQNGNQQAHGWLFVIAADNDWNEQQTANHAVSWALRFRLEEGKTEFSPWKINVKKG